MERREREPTSAMITRLVKKYGIPLLHLSTAIVLHGVSMGSDETGFERVNGIMLHDGAPFTGTTRAFFADGQPMTETRWKDGKKEGLHRSWYANGQLREERYYASNRKDGEHKGWYEDGSPRFVFHFVSGVYHGRCEEFYLDGSLYTQFNYEMGRESGSQKMWEPDGSIRANYVVKDGARYGIIGSKRCVTVEQ